MAKKIKHAFGWSVFWIGSFMAWVCVIHLRNGLLLLLYKQPMLEWSNDMKLFAIPAFSLVIIGWHLAHDEVVKHG